jgi:ribosome-associated protein
LCFAPSRAIQSFFTDIPESFDHGSVGCRIVFRPAVARDVLEAAARLCMPYQGENPTNMKENLALVLSDRSSAPRSNPVPSLEIASRIANACGDAKGKELAVLDVRQIFDLSDYFIVVSGRSDRHVQGICNRVLEELKQLGIEPQSIEGLNDGQWVLIDFGDVVMHVFYEPIRVHYDIESLWMRAKKLEVLRHEGTGLIELRAA